MPFLNLFWVLFWLDLPLQGILEPPCVTHRWEHHSAWIWGQLLQDWSSGDWAYLIKLELGGSIVHRKWDKNGKKRLEIVEFVLFYKRKYCTTILPDFYDAPSKRSKYDNVNDDKHCTTHFDLFLPFICFQTYFTCLICFHNCFTWSGAFQSIPVFWLLI